MLEIARLSHFYGKHRALADIGLSLAAGEIVAILGANGAGKSTLLKAISGLVTPATESSIRFEGASLAGVATHLIVERGIALVPEGRKMFASMTVTENLKLGAMAGRAGPWSIEGIIDIFPNLKKRLDHKTGHLSGGEQQATAIGRALMSNPDILLLDEVSLGLSPLIVDRVYASLDGLMKSGTTIILVEQDLGRAMSVADRVICMLEGRAVLEGRAKELTREAVTEAYFGLDRTKVGRVPA